MKEIKIEQIKPPEKFNPIKVSFVVDSKEELFDLWHRFNISNEDVKRSYNLDSVILLKENSLDDGPPLRGICEFYSIWNALDNIVQEVLQKD